MQSQFFRMLFSIPIHSSYLSTCYTEIPTLLPRMNLLYRIKFSPKTLQRLSFVTFMLAAIGIAMQHYLHHTFNNFKVFEGAFRHLVALKNLYSYYPGEYEDQFLYAPPAAIWLGFFSIFKTALSLILWNLLNAMSLWYIIYQLPKLDLQTKNKIAFFAFVELTTSLHNVQSNPVLTAMILLSFVLLEYEQIWKSHFVTSLAFFTKGISGAGVFLLLFYKPLIKNMVTFIITFLIVALSPAWFVGIKEIPRLYTEWFQCLRGDHVVNDGVSVVGLIHQNVYAGIDSYIIQLSGLGIFLGVLFYIKWKKMNTYGWRLFVLSYILIWLIIFNHAAESSGYVFAVTGVAIWLFNRNLDRYDKILLWLVFLFTILAPTDLYPVSFRHFLVNHSLKALPVVLVWIKMHADLWNPAAPYDLKYALNR